MSLLLSQPGNGMQYIIREHVEGETDEHARIDTRLRQ
jgi:hypothetical protein